jgi:hypothetical protein
MALFCCGSLLTLSLVWDVHEQVYIAALDTNNTKLANVGRFFITTDVLGIIEQDQRSIWKHRKSEKVDWYAIGTTREIRRS